MIGQVNLIKKPTLDKLMAFEVEANKDQITVSRNGEKRVLAFANEKRVYYIANGVVASAFVPLRETPV